MLPIMGLVPGMKCVTHSRYPHPQPWVYTSMVCMGVGLVASTWGYAHVIAYSCYPLYSPSWAYQTRNRSGTISICVSNALYTPQTLQNQWESTGCFFSGCYSCCPHIALLKHINSGIGLAHYLSVFLMFYTLPKYSTIDGQALAVCFPVATHAALIFPFSSISIQE